MGNCPCSIYTAYNLQVYLNLLLLHPPSVNKRFSHAFYGLKLVCIQILHLHTPKVHLHTWWDPDQYTMVLMLNNDHIIYYYMDATQSLGLVWTYFTYPDYLVVQCCVKTRYLSPDTVNQTGPQIYHYVKFFSKRVGCTPLGTLFDHIMTIIDHSNAFL